MYYSHCASTRVIIPLAFYTEISKCMSKRDIWLQPRWNKIKDTYQSYIDWDGIYFTYTELCTLILQNMISKYNVP